MIFNATKIGDAVCDMHYGSFKSHKALHETFAVRNHMEFPLSDASEGLAREQAKHLESWLDSLSRGAGRGPYVNKMLIISAENSDDGWMRVAYMYDSRRFGVAEIKRHSERLNEALTEGR